MLKKIIGREKEKAVLHKILESGQSEFVAVCGRRRIGKTFLIREALEKQIVFQLSGLANSSTKEQLQNFAQTIALYDSTIKAKPKNWLEAFLILTKYLLTLSEKRKVVFIDELPWLDTAKSDFMSGLEHFWNGWASTRKDIILVVCGSATSWMMDKLINNHGGLHNRLTQRIFLQPFTLKETEEMLQSKGISYSRYEVAECYMVLGGVPFYLSMLDSKVSLAQNIDSLLFDPMGMLHSEFKNLYAALFKNSEDYEKVVAALSTCNQGLTRSDILKKAKLKSGSKMTTILNNLEYCGFIRSYTNFSYSKKDSVYQLVDFYTLFYFRFLKDAAFRDIKYWSAIQSTPTFNTWAGLSFELLSLQHAEQIKDALGVRGVLTESFAWRSRENKAQIDLVLNRNDQTINICEMKFSRGMFTITKQYADELRKKMLIFQTETKTKKSLQLTMITSNGVQRNPHSSVMTNEVLLDDLFKS